MMQRQLIRRQCPSRSVVYGYRPPGCRRLSLVQRHASNNEPAPDRSSRSITSDTDARPGPSAIEVAEATVLEPITGSEASASVRQAEAQDAEAEAIAHQLGIVEPPLSTNRAAALQYGALGAVYAVSAAGVGFAALCMPQALLPAASAADPLAATLLGCLAVTYVRAAGVFLHLKGAADNGELLCLRHQRLAAAAALYGVVAVLSQAFGVASLQLAGLQLVLAGATAAVVVNVARSVLEVGPLVSVVQQVAEGSPVGIITESIRGVLESLTTVAGLLLLVLTGMGLYGFGAVVLAPPPPLFQAWPGQPAALDAASAGLRRLVGCGLLLLAAHAHALQDFAESVRHPPNLATLSGFRHFMLEHLMRTQDKLSKYYLPSPATYTALNLALLVSAALQAALVLRAPGLGVDVNWDSALWGPLYGTWFVAGLYGLTAAFSFDWQSASGLVGEAFAWAAGLVLRFFDSFVWKFQWAQRVRRV